MKNNLLNNDVIAAIATAPGQGAVGIVRLSGKGSLDVLARVFYCRSKLIEPMKSHYMYYGKIHNNGEDIDEVMVCPMLAPRSYTREDVVEIYAHGGMLVLHAVLQCVIDNGARLAEPGEFTKRAFLNGRVNLSQAEAVMDIISAGSEAARRAGLRQLGGGLSNRLVGLRDKILMWLAHIELSIDYPEHEEEAQNAAEISNEAEAVLTELNNLKESGKVGRILKEGIKTAIIGRPNVGKSTLLNAIIKEDRAIVHEKAGTTRDVLSEHVLVGDIPLLLMDTAGIRETIDPIEKIGVKKSQSVAEDAELILYVVDKSKEFSQENRDVLEGYNNKQVILLLNKNDLPTKAELPMQELNIPKENIIDISASTGLGLNNLYKRIGEIFLSGFISTAESDIITRERHRLLIDKAINHVQKAKQEIKMGTPEDLVSIELRTAYIALGEILGQEIGDDIVDRIFEEFCLGK